MSHLVTNLVTHLVTYLVTHLVTYLIAHLSRRLMTTQFLSLTNHFEIICLL